MHSDYNSLMHSDCDLPFQLPRKWAKRPIKVLDNRIWKTLRPVAHLWAAYIVQRSTTKRDPLGDRSEIGPLLDLAEQLLAEAASVQGGAPATFRALKECLQVQLEEFAV
jgi:hypothetical protein